MKYGELYTVPTPVEKEGYAFEGWFADEALTTPFDFEAPASVDGEVNVYAKWRSLTPTPTEEPTTAEPTGNSDDLASGGCSSSISFTAPVITMAIAGIVLIKKKKN